MDNRRSVTGLITTIGGMVTNWISKTQPIVTLSSTEAEYVALSVSAQDVKFQHMLLTEMCPDKPPPTARIHEDNTGAIFLSKNKQVGGRTKHIDVRHHFIRDLIHMKILEVVFVRSEENVADILTKHVSEILFKKHAEKLLAGHV